MPSLLCLVFVHLFKYVAIFWTACKLNCAAHFALCLSSKSYWVHSRAPVSHSCYGCIVPHHLTIEIRLFTLLLSICVCASIQRFHLLRRNQISVVSVLTNCHAYLPTTGAVPFYSINTFQILIKILLLYLEDFLDSACPSSVHKSNLSTEQSLCICVYSWRNSYKPRSSTVLISWVFFFHFTVKFNCRSSYYRYNCN